MIESLIAGLLASMTPCILVLFPITLYRFLDKGKIDYKEFALYALGFMSFFVIIGALLDELVSSSIRSAILLFLAVSLVALGLMQLLKKLNPLELYPVKNTFLFGAIFSFGVATSPCAIPFLGSIAGFSMNRIILSMALFGLGVLIAPTILLFAGEGILKTFRMTGAFIERMNLFLGGLLIASGLYLGFSISSFNKMDVLGSGGMVLLLAGLLGWLFMTKKSWQALLYPKRVILIVAIALILLAITFHCYNIAQSALGYCGSTCFACKRCLYLFLGAIILTIGGNYLLERDEISKLNRRRGRR